jgi:hypothetical protein
MPRFDDDDDQPDPEAAVFTLNLQRACEALLADLMRFEHVPAQAADRDKGPRLYPSPVRAVFSSPAQMCVDFGRPSEVDGRR